MPHVPPILLDLIIPEVCGEEHKLCNFSICNYIYCPVPSFLPHLKYPEGSSLKGTDHISHPYKTGKIIVLNILTFRFLCKRSFLKVSYCWYPSLNLIFVLNKCAN
jgi:hypothetical protein